MTGPGLFDPGAPRLRTIPPGANFLAELARALVAEKEVSVHPDALADVLTGNLIVPKYGRSPQGEQKGRDEFAETYGRTT